MTYEMYLQSLTDAQINQKIECLQLQCDTGITINSDAQVKEDWLNDPMCGGAILDNPCGDIDAYEDELERRLLEGDIIDDSEPIEAPLVVKNRVQTAGFMGTNLMMILIVVGFVYYAHTQKLLTK